MGLLAAVLMASDAWADVFWVGAGPDFDFSVAHFGCWGWWWG